MLKSIYDRHISVRLSILVLLGLVVALAVLGYAYWRGDADTKLGTLLGGLVASFVAVIIQFTLAMAEHREVERLKKMGFRTILPDRNERRVYYANLLAGARKKIDFIGNTGRRFLDDFAYDDRAASPRDRLLLDALDRNVAVRMLIANADDLPEQKKEDHAQSVCRMEQLKKDHSGRFDYRFLQASPTQTYVRVDRACIFGPVFPNIESRVTPAIHADTSSPFLSQYFAYFDREWLEDPVAAAR